MIWHGTESITATYEGKGMRNIVIHFCDKDGSFEPRPHYQMVAKIMNDARIIVMGFESDEGYQSKLSGIKNTNVYIETTHKERIKEMLKIMSGNNNKYFKRNKNMIGFFNDKFKCYEYLSKNNFKQQKTQMYEGTPMTMPFVLKALDGLQGKKVWLIRNQSELDKVISENKDEDMLMQEYYEHSFGVDCRVIITPTKEYFYKRVGAPGSFKSNVGQGQGSRVFVDNLPPKINKEIDRLRTLMIVDFPELASDYFAIDLFESEEEFNIIEMNYNPGIPKDLVNKFPGMINEMKLLLEPGFSQR